MCSLNISNYKPIFYTIVTVNHNLGTEISVSFRICLHKQSTVPNFSVHISTFQMLPTPLKQMVKETER
jgi:hypothetical protein